MLKPFFKKKLSFLIALFLLNTMNASLIADDCCCYPECNRFYIGGFGGELFSRSTDVIQTGTAFYPEDQGGPLAVDARGRCRKKSPGFGGFQIGYEWLQSPLCLGCSDFCLTPAAEIEGYFYRHTKRGDLINPTNRLPEHDFQNSFPMHVGAYFANGVLSLRTCLLGKFTPYVGGGIGTAHISIRDARSKQVAPPEAGINHFNSKRSDSTFAFAAQAKAGVRYNIFKRFHIFGEYRYLFVDSSRFNFGSTIYPNHVPTSPWNVDVKRISYNGFAFGLQFDL